MNFPNLFQNVQNIYDDYKFVTNEELIDFGLDYLKGTNLLRSYMHGHFIDIRLYNKVKKTSGQFSVDNYKSGKIQKVIDAAVPNRVAVKPADLPKYNQKIASHYLSSDFKNKKNQSNLLEDNRFKGMFEDPDFIVDESTDDYRLVRPVLARLSNAETKNKKMQAHFESPIFTMDEPSAKKDGDSDEELIFSADEEEKEEEESSSDDDRMSKALKRQHKILKKEKKRQSRQEEKRAEREEEPDMGRKVKKIEVGDGQQGMSSDFSKRIAR